MKLKIGIIGPTEAGKTSLANVLASSGANLAEGTGSMPAYRPTDSVRIVELSIPSLELKKFNTEVDIQLWEVGGNPKLKAIWPAVQKDLDGVIIVYNVHSEAHIKDSSALHMHFVTHSPDGMSQCLIVGNVFKGMRDTGPQRILGIQKRTRHFTANIEDDAKTKLIMDEFMQFVSTVAQVVHEREKQNLEGTNFGSKYKSKKLTAVDLRNENEAEAQTIVAGKRSNYRRSASTVSSGSADSHAASRISVTHPESGQIQHITFSAEDAETIEAIKSAITARRHKSRR